MGAFMATGTWVRVAQDIPTATRPIPIEGRLLVNFLRQQGHQVDYGHVPPRLLYAAYLARLRVLPELAVAPMKRFWSGALTLEGVQDLLIRYSVDLVAVRPDARQREAPSWSRFLSDHFTYWSSATRAGKRGCRGV